MASIKLRQAPIYSNTFAQASILEYSQPSQPAPTINHRRPHKAQQTNTHKPPLQTDCSTIQYTVRVEIIIPKYAKLIQSKQPFTFFIFRLMYVNLFCQVYNVEPIDVYLYKLFEADKRKLLLSYRNSIFLERKKREKSNAAECSKALWTRSKYFSVGFV